MPLIKKIVWHLRDVAPLESPQSRRAQLGVCAHGGLS